MTRLRLITGDGAFRDRFPGLAEAAADRFGFRAEELLAGGRLPSAALSHARAIAAWAAYQTGTVSFPVLGRMLGMGHPAVRARVVSVANRRIREAKFRELCGRLMASVPAVQGMEMRG